MIKVTSLMPHGRRNSEGPLLRESRAQIGMRL